MKLQACLATLLLAASMQACGGGEPPPPRRVQHYEPTAMATEVVTPLWRPATDDTVRMSRGSFTLRQLEHEQAPGGRLVPDSVGQAVVERVFDTWVIENRYLRVTLLPAYGGRIISLINKTTGREALYRNPVAVPYGVGEGAFHHDWLQIVGGIFPTLGPEHGKAWNQNWALEVEQATPHLVTLRMRFIDTLGTRTPPSFSAYRAASGVQVDYRVSLHAGRAALDTEVTVLNPGANAVRYEYWTNVGLAPGSSPDAPVAGPEVEIIAPVRFVWSSWCLSEPRCAQTAAIEDLTQVPGTLAFDRLRWFRNWAQWGIFYAAPDMRGANFWGAINHANGEGLIRVADNRVTPGFKLWTFGAQSGRVDPLTSRDPARPFIELWAGTAREFFRPDELAPGQSVRVAEVYAATLGLAQVTHANGNAVAAVRAAGGQLRGQVTLLFPTVPLTLRVTQNERLLTERPVTPAANAALEIAQPYSVAQGGSLRLSLLTADGSTIFEAAVPTGE